MFFTNHEYDIELASWIYSALVAMSKIGFFWTIQLKKVVKFCRLFLLGLDKFGKGDWRSISRNFVISRTPTQVASHAQKYFIRLNSMNRDRRRSSIHDITSVNNGDVSTPQAPITGHQANPNPPSVPAMGASLKHRAHQPHMPPGVGMYGAPVGHPIAPPPGHIGSAVGTPVMLPPPGHHPHPPYMVPMAYPMPPPPPPPPMHQ